MAGVRGRGSGRPGSEGRGTGGGEEGAPVVRGGKPQLQVRVEHRFPRPRGEDRDEGLAL